MLLVITLVVVARRWTAIYNTSAVVITLELPGIIIAAGV